MLRVRVIIGLYIIHEANYYSHFRSFVNYKTINYFSFSRN